MIWFQFKGGKDILLLRPGSSNLIQEYLDPVCWRDQEEQHVPDHWGGERGGGSQQGEGQDHQHGGQGFCKVWPPAYLIIKHFNHWFSKVWEQGSHMWLQASSRGGSFHSALHRSLQVSNAYILVLKYSDFHILGPPGCFMLVFWFSFKRHFSCFWSLQTASPHPEGSGVAPFFRRCKQTARGCIWTIWKQRS